MVPPATVSAVAGCCQCQRTIDGLWACLGQLLDRFPPNECHNYFQHCGYP